MYVNDGEGLYDDDDDDDIDNYIKLKQTLRKVGMMLQ